MAQFTPIELRNGNGRHNSFGRNNIERQIINCDLMDGGDTPINDPEQSNGVSCIDQNLQSNIGKPIRTKEWGSYTEFLLASLSYAVGLGNIWRFPYLVYRNGGGAFFVPYFVMLFFVGIPLFVLEFAFGQYMQSTPVKVWVIAPLFTGIGYAMCLMSALVSIYYNMIIAWSVRYLTTSLFNDIAWSKCNNTWNTNQCLMHDNISCKKSQGTMLYNGTCLIRDCVFTANGTNVITEKINPAKNGIESDAINCSISDAAWLPFTLENSKMPSDEYFHNEVLGISSGIDDLGGIRMDLAVSLFICWVIVAICLHNGFKSMGKSSYFTAIFPYIVLTILLFRCVALEGAHLGISFYMNPNWSKIKNVHVWSDAAMQIFFSLSPCWGGIITLAKGNNLRHNFIKDALYISIGNCATSIYAGFVIFSIIGFMAHDLGSTVEEVVAQGAGLAFIAYPEAVSRLPISRLWAILFFTMLCTLGFGTQFTLIESVVATISETIYRTPTQRQKRFVLLTTITLFFFSGLILCTNAGMYILQLMDDHVASFSALLIGLAELFVIVWVYGVDRFLRNGQLMLGSFPMMALMWKIIWMIITPSILLALFISSIVKYTMPSYGNYQFPVWSAMIGWLLSMTSVSAIPIVAIYKILALPRGTFWERARYLMKPSSKWTPPQFDDDLETDEEGSSSDDHGNGNVRRMQILAPRTSFRRGHHQAPPHCDSQTALRDDEESVNQDDDNEDEVMSGVNRLMFGRGAPEMDSSRTLLNNNGFTQLSRSSSFDSDSETGINMRIFPPGGSNSNPPRRH